MGVDGDKTPANNGRVCASTERWLRGRGVGDHGCELANHVLLQLKENVTAVIPISLLLILTLLIFFQRAPEDAGLMVAGLFSAIVGLVAFAEGLRVLIMPLGEMVGVRMPQKHKLPLVLAVAGVLGILVTYAEPAIASLMPLGELVDRDRAPYLYFVLQEKQELMVLAIGIGVGFAAIIGTLRFLQGWLLKPLIVLVLVPTVAIACYMQWGNPDLRPLLGLAWDCGAVTTGPVTVPLLLALGIGVTRSEREKKAMRKSLLEAVNEHGTGSSTLEGFGIVTLASLCPVLAVELMSVILGAMYSKEYILDHAFAGSSEKKADQSPLKEVIYGFRAILPLVGCLILIIKVVLREDLPNISIFVTHAAVNDHGDATLPSNSAAAKAIREMGLEAFEGDDDEDSFGGESKAVAGEAEPAYRAPSTDGKSLASGRPSTTTQPERRRTMEEQERLAYLASKYERNSVYTSLFEPDIEEDEEIRLTFWHRYGGMIIGYCEVQFGMILFNLGLTYGFTTLADQAGKLLPAAFLEVSYEEKSPFYSYAGGLTIVFLTVFLLGFLATRAEPALNVLGRTVETMSNGAFTRKSLIYAVCIGVGSGMIIGSWKILFNKSLIYIILLKYALACFLSMFVEDGFTNVAWDSAGVTTGPVTVPFVLSLGIGFSVAVDSAEGFGMLTAASVAPIIAVQLAKIFVFRDKKPAAVAVEGKDGSTSPLASTVQPSVRLHAPKEGGDAAATELEMGAI